MHTLCLRTFPVLVSLVLASLAIAGCDAKDTLLRARDGAADSGTGGTGVGGARSDAALGGAGGALAGGTGGGTHGSGGVIASGGSGGNSGSGGNPGSGGAGSGGSSGNSGTGGAAKDGGIADGVNDGAVAKDVPASDDGGAGCGSGFPVGSSRPLGDGCNTCYCQSSGLFLCTTAQCPPADAAADSPADGGQCPTGQVFCPGCTPGTGTCGSVCTGAPCPAPTDAAAAKDSPGADVGSVACSQVTTESECDARSDCHSLFRSIGACGCGGAPGCCMRFLSCAAGATATCTPPATVACTIATPACDSPYVISYTPGCYEGCVKPAECSP